MRWRALRLKPSSVANTAALEAMRAIRRAGRREPKADIRTIHYTCRHYSFIVTAIPKVGTKSFRNLFANAPRFRGLVGTIEDEAAAVLPNEPFFRFGVVRNPWDRVRSCYEDKIVRAETLGNLVILSRFKGLYPTMSFEAFVEWLCSPEGSDVHADRHWISQHKLLTPGYSIGRLEALPEAMAVFSTAIGVDPIALPANHQSRSEKAPYSPLARNLIGERYAEDIARFGY